MNEELLLKLSKASGVSVTELKKTIAGLLVVLTDEELERFVKAGGLI
jgi:hypothetical protein